MEITEIWVDRGDYRNTKAVNKTIGDLASGDVLVEIDKFALTSNNVSYAVTGDMIGYWQFFPADEGWGIVPVWGMANVIQSNCADIDVGERLYGYFPMASHLVVTPGQIKDGHFMDMAAHRQPLPALYNQYMRTKVEPEFLKTIEDERCLYFPLFITSFVIDDFLADNGFFGANQVIVGSVSSKTGFGFASFLKNNDQFKGKIIGMTSAGNKAFVEQLGLCDQIVIYGDEDQIDASVKTVFVDMSGSGPLRKTLHTLLGDHMVSSQLVGATHWQSDRSREELPGARPAMFFAPAQIAKRDAEWGGGMLMKKGYEASAQLAAVLQGALSIEHLNCVSAAQNMWLDLLDNKVSGSRGIMVSLLD